MNEKTYRALRNAKFDEIVSKGAHYNKATLINCYTLKVHEKIENYTSEKITSSRLLYNFLKQIEDKDTVYIETFKVLFLNKQNQIKGYQIVSTGSTNACIVDAKVIFKVALDTMAESIVLSHNHPSGAKHPSEADLRLTKNIQQTAKALGVCVLDHIIMVENDYYSFSDAGIL